MAEIVVGVGDIKIGKGDVPIATYALGSCVGVCIYDEVLGLGGMLHAMLPTASDPTVPREPDRYVDTGMVKLYNTLCRLGGDKGRLKAKLIGGAKMFEYHTNVGAADIGTLNVWKAKEALKRLGIPLVREVTGGVVGRTIRFVPADGSVTIQASDGTTEVI